MYFLQLLLKDVMFGDGRRTHCLTFRWNDLTSYKPLVSTFPLRRCLFAYNYNHRMIDQNRINFSQMQVGIDTL